MRRLLTPMTASRLSALTVLVALSSCASIMGGGPPKPSYVVFFTERSAALDPPAVDLIAQAAAAAQAAPARSVLVLGWTDSVGSKPDDVILSNQRAKRVADALVADGVAPGRISRQGRGQTGNDPGVESRRVEISLSN